MTAAALAEHARRRTKNAEIVDLSSRMADFIGGHGAAPSGSSRYVSRKTGGAAAGGGFLFGGSSGGDGGGSSSGGGCSGGDGGGGGGGGC